MNNYHQLIERQIKRAEEKNNANLQKEWQENLNLERKIQHSKDLDEAYNRTFVDIILAKLIEKLIQKATDPQKEFNVTIDFSYGIHDVLGPHASLMTIEPQDVLCYADSYTEPSLTNYLANYFDEFFDLTCRNISTYTDVSITSEHELLKNLFNYQRIAKILSFKCTLNDLINMYYMEKQRQEYEDYYENNPKVTNIDETVKLPETAPYQYCKRTNRP